MSPTTTGSTITPIPRPMKATENDLGEINPNVIAESIQRIINRTPEEIAEVRRQLYALTPEPRPLPPGKTFDDVVKGTWPGDEIDEEIDRALEEMS